MGRKRNRSPIPALTLLVDDLPLATDEGFLRQLFDDYGRIPPNGIILRKHKSLEKAFAFITFETHEDAARAKWDVNYTKLDGVPIRISWNDPETKEIRRSGLGKLIICGLEESIEVSQLDNAFSNFGEVIFCDIPTDENGRSCGHGIVQFRNPADAEKARVDLQGAVINGKPVTIEEYSKYRERTTFTLVFIEAEDRDTSLPFMDEEELAKIFEPFGEIQSVGFTFDENNILKTIGFCRFRQNEAAVRAFEELNSKEICGIKLTVSYEHRPIIQKNSEEYHRMINEQIKGRSLYVKNFGLDVTEEEFEEYFKQFGEVEKIKIARAPQEPFESKGFGFVLFRKVEEATKAIRETPITPLKGSQLFVALFKTEEDRMREKARKTRFLNRKKEFQQQFQMAQKQVLVPMQQMAPATPLSSQIMYFMGPLSFKDRIKLELHDRGITGKELMKKLSSITEEQAKNLYDNQEKLNEWLRPW